MKKFRMLAAIFISMLLCGCSTSPVSQPSYFSTESSAAPFDVQVSPPSPEDPFITYLGNETFEGTRTLELYQNSCSEVSERLVNYIRVEESELEETLSKMLASDNSPDLCRKTENAIPYLVSKNLFEDLTNYIDVSAPQWSGCADIIESCRFNGARYFYPTEIIYSPQFLIYDKDRLRRAAVPDPAVLMKYGVWDVSAMKTILSASPFITGENVADNWLAVYGKTLVSRNDQGKYVFSDDEDVREAYGFIKSNTLSEGSDGISEFMHEGAVFLSGSEQTLSALRAAYPKAEFGIVPYPQSVDIDYCRVETRGYLVPEGAKNIKGAASFINCSRLAADETTSVYVGLNEADIKNIELIRSPEGKKTLSADVYRFDPETNSALEGFYDDSGDSDWDKLILEYEPVIERGLDKINSLNKMG